MLELDSIRVKGKTEPEMIYSIIGAQDKITDPDFVTHQANNTELLQAYRETDWSKATKLLKTCRESCEPFALSGPLRFV